MNLTMIVLMIVIVRIICNYSRISTRKKLKMWLKNVMTKQLKVLMCKKWPCLPKKPLSYFRIFWLEVLFLCCYLMYILSFYSVYIDFYFKSKPLFLQIYHHHHLNNLKSSVLVPNKHKVSSTCNYTQVNRIL